jgi:ApbE superfamily uncharacterized protein (UPF0280 family)
VESLTTPRVAYDGPGKALAALMPGGRLHLQHGPIDIIAQAWGKPLAVRAGYARAAARFSTVLQELVAELPTLRSGMPEPVSSPIARAMSTAVAPFRPLFITPMAAVAGAVADEILAALTGPGIDKAHVNNGGDIALHLEPGQALTCALAATGDRVTLQHDDRIRGIATSGWRGRSFSLGIADAVTVLAPTGAMADAAATMLANAVDLPDHPGINRQPARLRQADSDLVMLPVTVDVPPLSSQDRSRALARGMAHARVLQAQGLIKGALLLLQGERQITGAMELLTDRGQE